MLIAYNKRRREETASYMNTQEGYIGERLKEYDSTDYAKWQQQRFDNIDSDEFQKEAIAYSRENPFCRKGDS